MKSIKILSILFSFISFTGYSQLVNTDCSLNISFYNKGKSAKIEPSECSASFINNDTITPNPDSLYKMKYPFKDTKLIIKYKGIYTEIASDKYLNWVYIRNETIFIEIYLHPKNKNGGYFISYEKGDHGIVEKFGKKEKKGHNHNIDFTTNSPFPLYPKIK